MSRFLQMNIKINTYLRFTGKALKDFTEGSLSLKPESISYCNEIQAKFDDDGDVDGEYNDDQHHVANDKIDVTGRSPSGTSQRMRQPRL